jgi:hypothetical protein
MTPPTLQLTRRDSMHPIIAKTFGGLSTQYYFRHLFFGGLFFVLIIAMMFKTPNPIHINVIVFMAITTLLYPYSRFVYESIANFIMGDNVFFVNAIMMLFIKLITMMICWSMAIFIAPIGLAYLYFYHSKAN